MVASKFKKAIAAFGVAASAAVCSLVNLGSDISAADSSAYTEGTGFGTAIPGLAFATAIVVVAVVVYLAGRYCKKE